MMSGPAGGWGADAEARVAGDTTDQQVHQLQAHSVSGPNSLWDGENSGMPRSFNFFHLHL